MKSWLCMSLAAASAIALCPLTHGQAPATPASPQTAPAAAAPAPVAGSRSTVCSVDLGAPPAEVFRSFTTAEGLKRSWSVAQAQVDFRVGGKIRTRYDKEGDLNAPTAIVNTILAYEPDRMLAIKPSAPEGSPAWLKTICETGWNVLRLEPIGPGGQHTRLTLVGLGYGEGPEYDEALKFFDKGNRWTLDKMKELYPMNADAAGAPPAVAADAAARKVIELDRFVAAGSVPVDLHKEIVVNAAPGEVFKLWTTNEGFKSFLGVTGNIDLRIGGPMELYFGPTAPLGERGSEGCQILSYLPDRMLSYSWNAPPKFVEERQKRTWLVVMFHPVDGGKTRVEMNHLGFGPRGEGHWDEVRAYFDRAWGNVLKALEQHVSKQAGLETAPAAP